MVTTRQGLNFPFIYPVIFTSPVSNNGALLFTHNPFQVIHIDPKSITCSIRRPGIIGITSGCFDLLHPMHVEYLNKCRKCCDTLLVLIDSDMLTWTNKQKLPVINQLDRAYMVDNLQSV